MHKIYQIKHPYALWHRFRYTITDDENICYRIRRSGLGKYRQFEDINQNVLYYFRRTTFESNDHKTVAQISTDGKTIKTIQGNFILTDINHDRQNYTLKLHDQIIAQVRKNRSFTNEQTTIELMNIHEQDLQFLLALLILIDSFNQTIQNPMYYFPIPHRPL